MNDIDIFFENKLRDMRDPKYQQFQCRLMPTIAPERVIGVRVPDIRKLAKEYKNSPEAEEFIKYLPHRYYEENNLHSFFLEQMKDYNSVIKELDRFLPYVDNWATCDSMKPKVFSKHLRELPVHIRRWIASGETYTVRFGIEMLMNFYLGEEFDVEYNELIASIKSEEYYVNMMIAWYFATALAKQYEKTLPYIMNHRISDWAHNKSIQKAIESYRITDEQKNLLRSLKVK